MNRIIQTQKIKKYIHNNLGGNPEIKRVDFSTTFPAYLNNNFDYYELNYLDMKLLLVFFIYDNKDITAILKRIKHISALSGYSNRIICVFDEATSYLRKKLIGKRIAFIIPGKQIFIPLLGMVYTDKKASTYSISFSNQSYEPQKMTPSSQALLLELLITGDYNSTQEELAHRLGITKMSVSRAFSLLYSFNIIKRIDRDNVMVESPYEIWKRAEKYFISPIQKYLYIDLMTLDSFKEQLTLSGESALSEISPLVGISIFSYAISAKNWKETENKPEALTNIDYNVVKLEIWKYKVHKLKDKIHPLALYLALKSTYDERVQSELERIPRKYLGGN